MRSLAALLGPDLCLVGSKRHMDNLGAPVERFVEFKPNCSLDHFNKDTCFRLAFHVRDPNMITLATTLTLHVGT
jgi:hypothetical protein